MNHPFLFSFEGPGIHTGVWSRIHVQQGLPSHEHQVVFKLGDKEVTASPEQLMLESQRATNLTGDGVTIQTVEHLLFALFYYFPENIVEVTCEMKCDGTSSNLHNDPMASGTSLEIPILDGSALPFVRAFSHAGLHPECHFFCVHHPIHVADGSSHAWITPCTKENEYPEYTVQLEYPDCPIGDMTYRCHPQRTDGIFELAAARTFALEAEVNQLRAAGLGKGGTLENTLVIGKDRPLNPAGMRFSNEPARHKMLDMIGDLAVLGALPLAHIEVIRPGHRLNHRIIQTLSALRRK